MEAQNFELDVIQQEIIRILQENLEAEVADAIRLATMLNLIQAKFSDESISKIITDVERAIKTLKQMDLIEICHPSLRWADAILEKRIIDNLSVIEEVQWNNSEKRWTQVKFQGNPGWFLMLKQVIEDELFNMKPALNKMI